MEDSMSQREAGRQRVAPPQIDCSTPVKLADRPGLPEQYHQFEPESALAIRAALGACRPLLVRGEPGVGKTQLAAAAAKVLGRPMVQKVVESRTESRELLWEFDAVQRLAEAQIAGAVGSLILGQAPADPAAGPAGDPHEEVSNLLRTRLEFAKFVRPGPLWWGFDWEDAKRQAGRSGSPIPALDGEADPRNGWVVLIDEIDKAEADLPNGLLEALGAGEFTPLGQHQPVKVAGEFPLVIITTNEERVLPNAFIRRCLVLHLKLPEDDKALRDHLVSRARVHFPRAAKVEKSAELFQKSAELLVKDRRAAIDRHVTPLPGQAEYLDLIRAVLDLEPDSPAAQLKLLENVAAFALRKHEEIRS